MTTNNHISGLEESIGRTPMVCLTKLLPRATFNLYAKLELLNPGGSLKDRAAFSMIQTGLRSGAIKKSTTIVESSSGNMGIGLAQSCNYFGLKFICVVDERANAASIKIMQSFGAQIVKVRSENNTSKLLQKRLEKVQSILKELPNAYWINQYDNSSNSKGYWPMMSEILDDLDGKLDYLFCATGTCGTLRGCSDYLDKNGYKANLIAVDAVGSVIFGGSPQPRYIPGHGSSVLPGLFKDGIADEVIYASDIDCVRGCRELLKKESILAGGSTGAVVSALKTWSDNINPGSNVVIIIADRGERYLDNVYNNSWIKSKLGVVL